MAGIAIRGVTKRFRDTEVLKSVSLDVAHGEFLTLVGPSGCGKTTLLRIIAGLEQHDAGEVSIGGEDVSELAPKQRDVALVFQSYALYPYMTVAENVALPLVMRRLDAWQRLPLVGRFMPDSHAQRASIAAEVDAVAGALGIGHLLSRRPAQLSGGQRQRVALARALVRRPKAFLMDEPLSNLDAKMRVLARAEIAELHRRLGATFVYVTHDQSEAMTMSDRVAVMMDGRLLQVAAPQIIYDDPADLDVARFIGNPEINALPAQVRRDGAIEVLGRTWPMTVAHAPGTALTIGIRPESFTVEAQSARDGGAILSGQVRHLERLGSETLVHVEIVGHAAPVIARVDPRLGMRLGLGGAVALTAHAVLAFDPTGKRIALQDHAQPRAEVAHG